MAQPILADETLSHLHRLSQKPGVQATLILSRSTGAIVRSSGLVSRDDSVIEPETANLIRGNESNGATNAGPNVTVESPRPSSSKAPGPKISTAAATATQDNGQRGALTAEDIAMKAFKFFADATEFADGMDKSRELDRDADSGKAKVQDDVRLMRLRMRRKEVVIVPDAKFLLVVIHDTPPA